MPVLSVPQANVFTCHERFRVLVAGRRFGKTFLAISELLRGAAWPGFVVWYIAPTYREAKQIAWERLKEMARPLIVGKPNETDLSLRLSTGGYIALRGADNPDSLRGVGLDGVVIDEAADISPEVWTQVLRPALSDRLGWALWIGTPKGYNSLHKTYTEANEKPGWAAFKYTTLQGGQVPASEVEAARSELDEKTFRQEYEASFESTAEGKVYYSFERTENVKQLEYNPRFPLCWSLDFNNSPMCSVIAQIVDNKPPQRTWMPYATEPLAVDVKRELNVLDEICILDSNIPQVCEEFKRRAERYVKPGVPLEVRLYGDATGNSKLHVGTSDYETVKLSFRNDPRFNISWQVPASNPEVRERVNAMNSMLCSASGVRKLWIDPRCKELITDLEQVVWKTDMGGNTMPQIDKRDGKRTHACFAAGTMVELPSGPSPIEQIPESGLVRTWDGSFVPYNNARLTRRNAELVSIELDSGDVIDCTPEHQWLTEHGWTAAQNLKGLRLIDWKSGLSEIPVRTSMEVRTFDMTGRNDIFAIPGIRASNIFIGSCGFTTTDRFLKAAISIIEMATGPIIRSKTLKILAQEIMSGITRHLIQKGGKRRGRQDWSRHAKRLQRGIEVLKAALGISLIINLMQKNFMQEMCPAFAGSASGHLSQHERLGSAVRTARRQVDGDQGLITKRGSVRSAESRLKLIDIRESVIAHAPALASVGHVNSVRPSERADVYCLFVPSTGCFALANGMIVSNSDGLGYLTHREFSLSRTGGGWKTGRVV